MKKYKYNLLVILIKCKESWLICHVWIIQKLLLRCFQSIPLFHSVLLLCSDWTFFFIKECDGNYLGGNNTIRKQLYLLILIIYMIATGDTGLAQLWWFLVQ
jgi:hypothetical protein